MLLTILLIQAAASSSVAPAAPQPAPAQSQEQKVCKRIHKAGSNLARKICLSPAEWANEATSGRDKAENANRPF